MLNCIFKSLVAWQNSLEILQEQTLLKYSSLAASSSRWVQTWSEEIERSFQNFQAALFFISF